MLPAPPFAAFACAFSLALADFWPLPPPMVFRRKRDERKRKERIGVKKLKRVALLSVIKTLARVYWFFTAMVRF